MLFLGDLLTYNSRHFAWLDVVAVLGYGGFQKGVCLSRLLRSHQLDIREVLMIFLMYVHVKNYSI